MAAAAERDSDNKVSARKNLDIVFLLLTAENSNPKAHGITGIDYRDCKRREPQPGSQPEALANAAKFMAPFHDNHLILQYYFSIFAFCA
jgi:hypothetical protein